MPPPGYHASEMDAAQEHLSRRLAQVQTFVCASINLTDKVF